MGLLLSFSLSLTLIRSLSLLSPPPPPLSSFTSFWMVMIHCPLLLKKSGTHSALNLSSESANKAFPCQWCVPCWCVFSCKGIRQCARMRSEPKWMPHAHPVARFSAALTHSSLSVLRETHIEFMRLGLSCKVCLCQVFVPALVCVRSQCHPGHERVAVPIKCVWHFDPYVKMGVHVCWSRCLWLHTLHKWSLLWAVSGWLLWECTKWQPRRLCALSLPKPYHLCTGARDRGGGLYQLPSRTEGWVTVYSIFAIFRAKNALLAFHQK